MERIYPIRGAGGRCGPSSGVGEDPPAAYLCRSRSERAEFFQLWKQATVSGWGLLPGIWIIGSNRASYLLRSFQLGLTSAPTMPHFVQTMRGPNSRTRRSPGYLSTLRLTSWRQPKHMTRSDPTPFWRMLVRSIGSILYLDGRAPSVTTPLPAPGSSPGCQGSSP
jgi:hypothetical protein